MMTSRSSLSLALGMAALAGGLACGGGSDGGPPPSGRKIVLVANNEFQPTTVNITAGDTIVWSWVTGSVGHNIIPTGATSFDKKGNDVPLGTGTTDTDFFNAPTSHQVIFAATGTYEYYCSQHGTTGGPNGNTGMAGKVVVAP
jgi:plastocyanin